MAVQHGGYLTVCMALGKEGQKPLGFQHFCSLDTWPTDAAPAQKALLGISLTSFHAPREVPGLVTDLCARIDQQAGQSAVLPWHRHAQNLAHCRLAGNRPQAAP